MDSSSPAERNWTYDVFLSFRGKDTRLNFTAHLYMYLLNAGVRVFMDEPELGKGDEISESLIRGIQESRISLVVLSKNYASSSWCLGEVVCIMKCRREHEQKVLPIFYLVDPSDVRHLKGDFGSAFEKHKARETQDVISGWRSALQELQILVAMFYLGLGVMKQIHRNNC